MPQQKGTIAYLSHGGGPLPLLGDESHRALVDFLQNLAARLITPAAIVVVSAHWECELPTLTSGSQPALIYDYVGFPAEAYQIQYPAKGSPDLAEHIVRLLQQAGIKAQLDPNRGFDHGLFVPLKLLYPEAKIPCVQLSLQQQLDPLAHIQLGKALASLQEQHVLLLGSGFSFHNLPAFFTPSTPSTQKQNHDFEAWLFDTCINPSYSDHMREYRLLNWTEAPAARYCHPREEHLLPLQVCYGAAGRAALQAYTMDVLGKRCSAYVW